MDLKRTLGLGALGLAAVTVIALALPGAVAAQEVTNYEVTIENLTEGQPFTRPGVAAHTEQMDGFQVG